MISFLGGIVVFFGLKSKDGLEMTCLSFLLEMTRLSFMLD